MGRRILSFSLLLLLAIAIPALATPRSTGAGPDRWEQMIQDGWTPVAPGVLQRSQDGHRVETFATGPEGFSWQVRQLQAQLRFLQDEYRVRPTADLKKTIRNHRAQIRKMREHVSGLTLNPAPPALKTGCNFSDTAFAQAYPTEPTNGARAQADAYFNDGCGDPGETYAYVYVRTTLNGTTTTLTQTDTDTGPTVSSFATASLNGTADCYSNAYAYAYNQQAFYSAADQSFACLPDAPAVFADVPFGHVARHQIEAMYFAGITAGCSANPRNFCPDVYVSRANTAVFLIIAKGPAGYVPPPCTTPIFTDVPCTYWAAPWINEFARRGITVGCGGGNFCPDALVDRGTMAYFLLATLGVPAPTACTGMFPDVSCSVWYAPWVEELAKRGFSVGCGGGQYCPTSLITRAQLAMSLVRTFNVPLP